MECLHGKATSYNLLEGIYANAVAHKVERLEAIRVLKLAVDRDVLEHLQQLEKDLHSTFVDSLMELHQNTENHKLQCILNYLFHWRLEDPLESAAEAFFSCPPGYMYSVKGTGERFRSFEADHKIAYQGFLEKKLVEQFNKQS
jgi:hypothetical protein